MPTIHLQTLVKAPVQEVFDLSRNIDFHKESLRHTGEKAIAGKTSGLIGLGESVTWQARHFGITQELTSRVTEYQPPHFFVDEMVSGAFKSFRHEHHFKQVEDGTLMSDSFEYRSPLGVIGKFADLIFLESYMKSLI